MLKALSAAERLLALLWCVAALSACLFAGWEVFRQLEAYGGGVRPGGAAAAFAACATALGLLSYALSSHWRFLEKLGTLLLALCGDQLARGRLELWAAQEQVWRQWRRHQGENDAESTADAVYEFVRAVYGVDLNGAVKRAGLMTTKQLRRLVDGITSLLLRYRRANFTKAAAVGAPEGPAAGIDPARQVPEQTQPAAEYGQAYTTASQHSTPSEAIEYGTIEFELPQSTGMLVQTPPVRKKSGNAWGPQSTAQEDMVVEFDLPAGSELEPQRDQDMPSVEEILARAIQPQQPVKKAPAPQAKVESGAALRRITATEVHYVHVCKPCGYVEGAIRKARCPGPRTKFASSFKCPRCRNVQKVIISGEF